jgi:hypothetical protein
MVTGYVIEHKPQSELLTMCAAQVQKTNFRWMWTPFDICSLLYPLYSHEASQSEIRQIHRGLNIFFRLYEWHW